MPHSATREQARFAEARRVDLADIFRRVLGVDVSGWLRSTSGKIAVPWRKDEHPSLGRFRTKAGDWRWRDWAHDQAGDGIDAIMRLRGCTATEALELILDGNNQPTAPPPPQANPPKVWASPDHAARAIAKAVGGVPTVHRYPDADGQLRLAVVRVDIPDAPKKMLPYSLTPAGVWRSENLPAGRPLYNLPALADADEVHVVEGEKCADAGNDLGLVCTTSSGACGAAAKTDWTPLAGKRVVILPDNDKGGRQYANDVARLCVALDPPAEVRIVELPDMPAGGDLVDFIKQRGGQDNNGELVAELDVLTAKVSGFPNSVVVSHAAPDWPQDFGDSGLGRYFAEHHRGQVRAGLPTGKPWYAWTGQRWEREAVARVMFLADEMTRDLLDRANRLPPGADRDARIKEAAKLTSQQRCEQFMKKARSWPTLGQRPDDFDKDPYLFNVENGTVDLRTGKLRPHRPDDLLTKMATVEYDTDARCPLFLALLDRIMAGDGDMIGFLQRLFGMCLTAKVGEHVLPIFWGQGSNGKSTLLEAITGLLGDYACAAPPGLLVVQRNQEHPTELAGLFGKRLVIAAETEEGGRLRVGTVKQLTGDVRLRARFMRGDYFDFDRTHKTILVTNNKPRIRETTLAIWRRILLVPFNVAIPESEQDTELLEKLAGERPGILRWLITGCLDWQAGGKLEVPEPVSAATAEYRQDEDPLTPFLDDRCVLGAGLWVARPVLWRAYQAWADDNERSSGKLTRRDLFDRLRGLDGIGEKPRRDAAGRVQRGFVGIGLQAQEAAL